MPEGILELSKSGAAAVCLIEHLQSGSGRLWSALVVEALHVFFGVSFSFASEEALCG